MIDELIDRYQLEPHPEGGFYRRVFEHSVVHDGRSLASAIVYLLPGGVTSRWHRIDAVELWHAGIGAPLELSTSTDGVERSSGRGWAASDEVLMDVAIGRYVAVGARRQGSGRS